MSTTTQPAPAIAPTTASDPGRGWRRVAIVAALVVAAGDLLVQPAAGIVVPPLLVMAVLSLGAAALAWRRPRAGTWALLVVAVLGLALAGMFSLHGITHPDSPIDFAHALTSIVARVVSAVAAGLALRGVSAGARAGGRALAVAGIALLALSVVLGLTAASDAPATGDVELTAAGFAWSSPAISLPAGAAVHVTNTDRVRHVFALEDTAVTTELPAGTAQRVALDLDPGTYRLFCSVPGHETMTATLTVTS